MSRDFEMPVSSVFHMRGRGMVFAGVIRRGVVTIGDRLTVASPLASKRAVVAGLERVGTHQFIETATVNDEVAILCRGIEAEDLADGLQRVDEFGWKVLDLTVRSFESTTWRWWKRLYHGATHSRR